MDTISKLRVHSKLILGCEKFMRKTKQQVVDISYSWRPEMMFVKCLAQCLPYSPGPGTFLREGSPFCLNHKHLHHPPFFPPLGEDNGRSENKVASVMTGRRIRRTCPWVQTPWESQNRQPRQIFQCIFFWNQCTKDS